MKIKFNCSECDKKYTTDVDYAGKPFRCSNCGADIAVPTLPIANSRVSERTISQFTTNPVKPEAVRPKIQQNLSKIPIYRKRQSKQKTSINKIAWILIPIILGVAAIAAIALTGNDLSEKPAKIVKEDSKPKTSALVLPEIEKISKADTEKEAEQEPISNKVDTENDESTPKPEKKIPPLKIISHFPKSLMVEFEENIQLEAIGGVKPHFWMLSNGRLPAGMAFVGDRIVGKPRLEAVGLHSITLRCIDSAGTKVDTDITFDVADMLMFDYEGFPNVIYAGEELEYVFSAQGGQKPYSIELLDSNLPFGLHFDPISLKLYGKPSESGEFFVKLKVTDFLGRSNENSTETFILNIYKRDKSDVVGDEDDEEADDDEDPEPIEPPKSQLELLMEQGASQHSKCDYKGAIETYKKALKLDPNNAYAFYNIACAYGRLKDKDNAFEYLTKAVDAGFVDYVYIEDDDDLKILRSSSKFKNLIEKLKERYNVLEKPSNKPLSEQFPGYLIYKDEKNKLIFLTNVGSNEEKSKKILDFVSDQLMRYAKAQRNDYFSNNSDSYIKILLPDDKDFAVYRKQAGYSEIIGGWYNPVSKFLISRTLGHTLIHEFTHALHYDDTWSQKIWHAIWFSEGMATCFENSKLPEGTRANVVPIHNWRMDLAMDMVKKGSKKFVPFKTFLKFDRTKFLGSQNIQYHYAEARYIVYWLYEMGKLKAFYEAYNETYKKDKSGIKALEKVLDKSLSKIEEDWKSWMKKVTRPIRSAWLGVSTSFRTNPQGVKIDKVYKNSPAKGAKLKRGDIILRLGSLPVDTTNNFAYAMTTFEPGDEIELVYIRREEVFTVKVTVLYRENHKGY